MSIPISEYGFINVVPKSRAYRRGTKDKAALERRLINERVGPEARLHQRNAPETSFGLTAMNEGAAGYLANTERFHTDTSGEEYARRQQLIEKRKQGDIFRREQNMNREEMRWKQMEEDKRLEKEHWDKIRDAGVHAQKNKSKTAYNILSLDYLETPEGKEQKQRDDLTKHRAEMRSQNLANKSHMSGGFNIISGEAISDPRRGRMERK